MQEVASARSRNAAAASRQRSPWELGLVSMGVARSWGEVAGGKRVQAIPFATSGDPGGCLHVLKGGGG